MNVRIMLITIIQLPPDFDIMIATYAWMRLFHTCGQILTKAICIIPVKIVSENSYGLVLLYKFTIHYT